MGAPFSVILILQEDVINPMDTILAIITMRLCRWCEKIFLIIFFIKRGEKGWLFNAVFFDFTVECTFGNSEFFGYCAPAPVMTFQGLDYCASFFFG